MVKSKKCKIEITQKGVWYDQGNGEEELAVGTKLTLDEEPTGWANKYRVLSGGKKNTAEDLEAATQPAGTDDNAGSDSAGAGDDNNQAGGEGDDEDKADLSPEEELEELKAKYLALNGDPEKAKANWGIPAYKKAIAELENGNGDNF